MKGFLRNVQEGLAALRHDRRFRLFVSAQWCAGAAAMALPFYVLHASTEREGAPEVAVLLTAQTASSLLSNPGWGQASPWQARAVEGRGRAQRLATEPHPPVDHGCKHGFRCSVLVRDRLPAARGTRQRRHHRPARLPHGDLPRRPPPHFQRLLQLIHRAGSPVAALGASSSRSARKPPYSQPAHRRRARISAAHRLRSTDQEGGNP
jgi:hypothetical protein